MGLSWVAVEALATKCAPSVAAPTLVAVVKVESGFDPLAIGVNARRHLQLHPASTAEAVETAEQLIARGANIDLGLGQINARNLAVLGLTVAHAFDPCRNLASSAQVIADGYVRAAAGGRDEQTALRTSLSYYNTGTPSRGFTNGYVAKVTAAAGWFVPALHSEASGVPLSLPAPATPAAPAWDVFARAAPPAAGFVFTPTSRDRQ